MNKKSILQLSAVILVVLAAWSGYLVWRTSRNLVTLNVRNADVREVVGKLERQTWETILMDENVQGKVTFNVRRVPLEVVLGILEEQISSRWSVIYPLYTTSTRLDSLKQALRGEADAATTGWTNLLGRGGFGGFGGFGGRGGFGGPGGFGDPLQNQNQFVSLEIVNKDLPFATLAMNRYGQTRIIPEDGTEASINVKFNQTPVDSAVAKIAKQAKRSWTKLYSLRGERDRDRGGPGQLASREDRDRRRPEDGDRGRREWTDMTPEQREERRRQQETLEQELKQTLPPEERQKLDAAQQQREQMFQEMQNLTPEQRRERFSQMGGGPGGRDQRSLSRIKNTTPEQRFDRYQRYEQRRQRWEQQGGGSGGPGRGGR